MIADVEPEATPLRRLVVFAASFLGMLSFASATFSRDPPLLAPPLVAGVVVLAAAARLLVWVRGRWSRGLLWAAAGVAMLGSAATALLVVRVQAVALAGLVAGALGLVAAWAVAAALLSGRPWLMQRLQLAQWIGLASLLALSVVALGSGPGPTIGVVAAGVALLLAWMLRPEPQTAQAAST